MFSGLRRSRIGKDAQCFAIPSNRSAGEFSPHRQYGQSVARSGLKSVAQGSPWVALPTRISPEGATRYGDNWLGTFEPDRVRVSSPFSISNPEDRVFFMERTFMCLVRAKPLFSTNQGKPWDTLSRPLRATDWKCPNSKPSVSTQGKFTR
jgi:hypothetical protein